MEIKPELENVYFVYGCFSYYYQGVILSKAIQKLQSRANKNVLFQNSNQTKSNILNLWLPGKLLTSLFVAYEGPFFHWFFQTWLSSIFGLWKSWGSILIFLYFLYLKMLVFCFCVVFVLGRPRRRRTNIFYLFTDTVTNSWLLIRDSVRLILDYWVLRASQAWAVSLCLDFVFVLK